MEKLTKEQKHAKWVATPPALIERPLRYIAAKTCYNDKEKGKFISPQFLMAFKAAYNGDGATVQRIARSV